jgi:5-oxoprolinase (ATP-hydrolysing)
MCMCVCTYYNQEPHCTAEITAFGDILMSVGAASQKKISASVVDTIQLSVFANRFMSIAEQMGRTLQRTSISTNIKERLDFSCALFGPDGGLVANAPHLPVHLGAMQEAVKWQIRHLNAATHQTGQQVDAPAEQARAKWESRAGEGWNDGEVIMSNHPCAGGSHLPDITVITPVFSDGKVG